MEESKLPRQLLFFGKFFISQVSMIIKIIIFIFLQFTFSNPASCYTDPYTITYSFQQDEVPNCNHQQQPWSSNQTTLQREMQIKKLMDLNLLCQISPQQLSEQLKNIDTYCLFEQYHFYACKAYLEYLRLQPEYEAFILDFHKKIHADHPYRKSLRNIAGFKDKKGFTRLIDAEAVRIQQKHRERIRNQLQPNFETLNNIFFHEYERVSSCAQKLKCRYENRLHALKKTISINAVCRNYSGEIASLDYTIEYNKPFLYTYGTDLDYQLHTELVDIKKNVSELEYANLHNVHYQIICPAVHRIAAEAKKEAQIDKAFKLSDFCYVLSETLKAIGNGTFKAIEDRLSIQYWQDLALGPMQIALCFMDAVGKEEARQQMMLSSVYSKDFDDVFRRAHEHCQYTQTQQDAVAQSIQATLKKIKVAPWQKLLEKGTEFGSGIVLDIFAFNALNGFGRATGRATIEQLNALMKRGLLNNKQLALEVAGFGKIALEEGVEITPYISATIKNESACLNTSHQKSVSHTIKNQFEKVRSCNIEDKCGVPEDFVNLASKERTQHILYGDKTGGGHLWPGINGKSIFPSSWDANKVMHYVSDLATDPNIKPIWTRGIEGSLFTKSGIPSRYYVEGVREGITIRVVIEPANDKIITAFPIY